MTKKSKRKHKAHESRQRTFRVCVSKYRVAAGLGVAAVVAIFIGGFGVNLILHARPTLGASVIGGAVCFFYVFGYLWRSEIGRKVLEFEADGLRYYDRVIQWSEIVNVELRRRSESPDYLILTLVSGQNITIIDDYLSMSMDDLLSNIRSRL